MKWLLLALAFTGCGVEVEMARVTPRAPQGVRQSKNQERINQNRAMAEQDSNYAPDAWVRPATMPAVAATGSQQWLAGDLKWEVSRVRGITQPLTVSGVRLKQLTLVGDCVVRVALLRYDDSNGLRLAEVSRAEGVTPVSASPAFSTFQFPAGVALDPRSKYALAVSGEAAGGASVQVYGALTSAGTSLVLSPTSYADPVALDWDGAEDTPYVTLSNTAAFSKPLFAELVPYASVGDLNIQGWY